MEPHPRVFDMLRRILRRFYLQWKAFDLLNKVRYILGVVLLLDPCSVTNNGRHLGHHLGFYPKLQVRLKLREMLFFCALHEKQHTNKHSA